MRSDKTFRYGGALVMALIMGSVLGFATEPEVGVVAGLTAGAAWLGIAFLVQRQQ